MDSFKDSDEEDDLTSTRRKLASTLYDESIEVADAEEVRSPSSNSAKIQDLSNNGYLSSAQNLSIDYTHSKAGTSHMSGLSDRPRTAQRALHHSSDQSDNSDEDDDDDDEDDDDDVQAPIVEGIYNPSEFEHLNVSPEVKELFQNITRYTPQNIELDYKLKPFIPDFIPAVGDIDGFLKVPRPDGKSDGLGLTVLDEPCSNQSDPAVLHLQLRAVAKQSSAKSVVIKKVESAEKNLREIDRWVKNISDLHRSKPPPTVHYSRPMPDVDSLMQEWPPELEQQLKDIGIPSSELDCSLSKYIDIICSLFDIPIFESRIQSVHLLLSLYSAVKNSQVFAANVSVPSEGGSI